MLKRLARQLLERALRRFDYGLVDLAEQPAGLRRTCESLKARGFVPQTVVDVGVGPGTPWLYAAFPRARFELFEPIEAFRPQIESATAGLDVAVHYCALGEQSGSASIELNRATPTSSSMAHYHEDYVRVALRGAPRPETSAVVVPVRTLDEFGPFRGPTLVKLDVEGFEGHVIRGARRTLETVDVIISEVSVARRTDGEMSFGAYVALLESLDFSLADIAEIQALGRGGPIAYLDAVFIRTGSPMRYAAAMQP